MTLASSMNSAKTQIIEAVVNWQKEHYPDRTSDYEKCYRDLNIVFTAYIDDLTYSSTRNISYVSRRYWWNGQRQIVDYVAELALHNFMIDYVINTIATTASEEDKNKLIDLKNILVHTIEHGPEYMNYDYMHRYKYIMEYDTEKIPDEHVINQCLYEAWETTPSKQQFMPYNVFVLGPGNQTIKNKLYLNALVREYKTNFTKWDVDENDLIAVETAFLKNRVPPQYLNFKTAPYVLIFSQRINNTANPFNQQLVDRGWSFEQITDDWAYDESKPNRGKGLSMIEIGMFAHSFSNLCLRHNIDISFTRCLPMEMEWWSEFNFLNTPPQLIMTAGYGTVDRRTFYNGIPHGSDHRPDFDQVVKFIK